MKTRPGNLKVVGSNPTCATILAGQVHAPRCIPALRDAVAYQPNHAGAGTSLMPI